MGFRRSWSEDQIKEIKKLHDVNMLPFSIIAEKFNTTKNSIIGVYWRSNNMAVSYTHLTLPTKRIV